MASTVSRLVACLVAVVAVLQLVHLVLLNKLEKTRLHELQSRDFQDHSESLPVINGPQRLAAPPVVSIVHPESNDVTQNVSKFSIHFPMSNCYIWD